MNVVIIGAGHAGVQVADTLRAEGHNGGICLITEEQGTPYQRPPLSKDFMTPGLSPTPMPLRGDSFYQDKDITLLTGTTATSVDRAHRLVHTSRGPVKYDRLVLATGARNRALPCPGAALPGVHGLKTLADAERLNAALQTARDVVVIGAGFIGLEFAAAARSFDARVTVLEFAPRVMGRAVTPILSEWFAQAHRDLGVELRVGEGIDHFEAGTDSHVAAAISTTGSRYAADLVVVGVGVLPNDGLATQMGLDVDNGVLVDDQLRTSDPAVFAIGDCANFPSVATGGRLRLESVQNATDQGRHVAQAILGVEAPYTTPPWFWSVQGPHKLQMAGIASAKDDTVILGDPDTAKFSILSFRDDVLTAVQSVNRPADHIAARQLLASDARPTRTEAAREGFTLRAAAKKQLLPAAA